MGMFRLLRFEMGGLAAILWTLLFLSPYFNFQKLFSAGVGDLTIGLLGSLVISLPLGNYVHQISESFFSPYLSRRARVFKRKSNQKAKELFPKTCGWLGDSSYQVLHVLSQTIEPSFSRNKGNGECDIKLNVQAFGESIRNRYSYYYARLECGAVSPIFGYLIARILLKVGNSSDVFYVNPSFPAWWIYVTFLIVCIGLAWRIPQLFREIDDLETALLVINQNSIRKLLSQEEGYSDK